MEHLWRNDIEEVSRQSVLLREYIVLIRLEGNAKHVDNKGAGRQVERDAVLPQERLQLGCLLLQELQSHFCSFQGKIERKSTLETFMFPETFWLTYSSRLLLF